MQLSVPPWRLKKNQGLRMFIFYIHYIIFCYLIQGVSKRALQWYSKCYCVASVTKTTWALATGASLTQHRSMTLRPFRELHCHTMYLWEKNEEHVQRDSGQLSKLTHRHAVWSSRVGLKPWPLQNVVEMQDSSVAQGEESISQKMLVWSALLSEGEIKH
jgi:hypothetical protein